MRFVLLTIFLLLYNIANCQTSALPSWFLNSFKKKELDKKYELSSFLKPSLLQADFTGDAIQDIAVLIIEKTTKKKGILLIHSKSNEHFIFGAGNAFENGGVDFKWADKWSVYKKKKAIETQFNKESGDFTGEKEVVLQWPGILIENYEDGAAVSGGIIYWNGHNYIWIHQGE